ncbi:MAG: hypothetical protein HOP28_16435 [Gemmatimonadales bacterium]|nr:hypothetical protein [Gemmatimonadales bacterium]
MRLVIGGWLALGLCPPLAAQRDTLVYRAAIAAADGALAAGDTRGARRWLNAAPSRERGWEWGLLNVRSSNASIHTFPLDGAPSWAVAISPDGGTVAAGTSSGEVRLIDRATGATRATLRHAVGVVYDIAFSPDGAVVASAGAETFVKLWNPATGAVIDSLSTGRRRPLDVTFSADGRRLAASLTNGAVMVWELPERRPIRTLTGHVGGPPVPGVAILPDGRIASASWDQHVRLWNPDTGDTLRTVGPGYGHSGPYAAWSDVAADPRGRYLAAVGRDGLHIWSLSDWTERTIRGIAADVPTVAISPDGQLILTGSTNQRVELWHADDGAHLGSFVGHEGAIRSVTFSGDGALAVSTGDDGTVRVWDIARMTAAVARHSSAPYVALWSPDGRYLATGAHDGHLNVYEPSTGRFVRDVNIGSGPLVNLMWTTDQGRIIAVSERGQVKVWDVRRPGEPAAFLDSAYAPTVSAQSADRRQLFTVGADRTLRIWDGNTGAELRRLTLEGKATPRSLGMANGRNTIVVGWSDGSAEAWDLAADRLVGRLQGTAVSIRSFVGLPGGRNVLLGTESGELLVWDMAASTPGRRLRAHDDRVTGLSLSPDGSRVVSTSFDNVARIWDVADLTPTLTLRGFANYTHCSPFSPDGRTLAICVSSSKEVRLFRAEP